MLTQCVRSVMYIIRHPNFCSQLAMVNWTINYIFVLPFSTSLLQPRTQGLERQRKIPGYEVVVTEESVSLTSVNLTLSNKQIYY